jgi:signal peptidase II
MKLTFRNLLIYLMAALVIAIDQLTKAWVRANLAVGESREIIPGLGEWVRLLYIENTGAAFGMFQAGGLIFTIVAILVSIAIVYYSFRMQGDSWALRVILGLQLGGALGNLIDRLTIGPVTDFISLFSIWNAPIFNVADASITTGVVLMILAMLLNPAERDEPRIPGTEP